MTVARLTSKRSGDFRVVVGRHGKALRCMNFRIFGGPGPKKARPALTESIWPVVRRWNRAEEALYSAFVREMFHAPRGEELAFARLTRSRRARSATCSTITTGGARTRPGLPVSR